MFPNYPDLIKGGPKTELQRFTPGGAGAPYEVAIAPRREVALAFGDFGDVWGSLKTRPTRSEVTTALTGLNARNVFAQGQGETITDTHALNYAVDAALYKSGMRTGYNGAKGIKCQGTIRYSERKYDRAFRKIVQRTIGVARYVKILGLVQKLKKGPATLNMTWVRDRGYYPGETAVGDMLKSIIPGFTS